MLWTARRCASDGHDRFIISKSTFFIQIHASSPVVSGSIIAAMNDLLQFYDLPKKEHLADRTQSAATISLPAVKSGTIDQLETNEQVLSSPRRDSRSVSHHENDAGNLLDVASISTLTDTKIQDTKIEHDDFGPYQEFPLPPNEEVNIKLVAQSEDDEFGEFVESPRLFSARFDSSNDRARQEEKHDQMTRAIPEPRLLLQFLADKVLIVPQSFISALASVAFPQRQAVLNHADTKRWLLALVEGSVIAQRVIRGYTNRVVGAAAQDETAKIAVKLAYQWEKLIPRITSLSMNRMHPKTLSLTRDHQQVSAGIVGSTLCGICGTNGANLHGVETRRYHKSCQALVERMNSID